MAATFKLDGILFPKDPLTKRWSRRSVAVGGAGENIYSGFWSVELNFGILSATENSFFETRFLAGGLHTAVLPHPQTGALVGFTGVNVQEYTAEFNDIDSNGWVDNPTLILNHINLAATGTV